MAKWVINKAEDSPVPKKEAKLRCRKCGQTFEGIMFFSCPDSECPTQLKIRM